MLKLHKLFTYSKHFFLFCFQFSREGLLSVWKFTIVYYLVKYSNISAQTHMCPPQRTPTHMQRRRGGRGKKKVYIF